jgi:hypothetical protein
VLRFGPHLRVFVRQGPLQFRDRRDGSRAMKSQGCCGISPHDGVPILQTPDEFVD